MTRNRLASIGLSVMAGIGTIHFATNHIRQFGSIQGHTVPAIEEPTALVRSLRPVYPYSVIAGGAYSPAELRYAHGKDDLVRTHYSDFDLKRAKMVMLTEDRYQYVSYRSKNQIYWTKRKLRIPKGELLLTDGAHFARARCGNRLSDTPHSAAADSHQADPVALSMPTVTHQMLPDMAMANPPALGGLSIKPVFPSDSHSGATTLSEVPLAASPTSIMSPAGGPIATGFTPPPVLPGSPLIPSVPNAVGPTPLIAGSPFNPSVPSNPLSPNTPSTPVTPNAPQPPAETMPVPEPSTIGMFVLTFLISAWALVRMQREDETDSSS